jgi:hypothetical protein
MQSWISDNPGRWNEKDEWQCFLYWETEECEERKNDDLLI